MGEPREAQQCEIKNPIQNNIFSLVKYLRYDQMLVLLTSEKWIEILKGIFD